MLESNDYRVEARECLSKANRCDNSLKRLVWLLLAKNCLLLAEIQETATKSIKVNKSEPAFAQCVANTMQNREPALSYVYYEAGV
jgi:hypothetical protein